ncbi:zinc-dependent alcohol dehydrogenase family protein [Novosphingobium rosa]|uniref:zinc-dependent alcohol dehydrogenase family protein n=1 Tax=Novosphingobium rosa TaxID=76978 RepID=UPI0008361981|nr:NAD(P)-dependent alcohol dehydrogenase [Novosphingobium rosa]
MKAWTIGGQTGIAALTPATCPDPVAGPGEVVVRVTLASLNHRDLMLVEGRYGAPRSPDRIALSEGVGRIAEIGPGVAGFAPGDRVVLAHLSRWQDGAFSPDFFGYDLGITHDGWLAEYIRVPASALVKLPGSLTDQQAATLASGALTAWNAVVETGRVKAGDLVLTMGTGGVSMHALQIARAHGARVAITSSSDAKLERARALGADITVNHRTHPDWPARLLALTGEKGADVLLELGGPATLSRSIGAMAPEGRIVLIGQLAGRGAQPLDYGPIIRGNLTLSGIAEGSRAMLQRLARAVDANAIHPAIDRIFPFDAAREAFAHLKAAAHVGKVLIEVAP